VLPDTNRAKCHAAREKIAGVIKAATPRRIISGGIAAKRAPKDAVQKPRLRRHWSNLFSGLQGHQTLAPGPIKAVQLRRAEEELGTLPTDLWLGLVRPSATCSCFRLPLTLSLAAADR